jgi:hypothetical protein
MTWRGDLAGPQGRSACSAARVPCGMGNTRQHRGWRQIGPSPERRSTGWVAAGRPGDRIGTAQVRVGSPRGGGPNLSREKFSGTPATHVPEFRRALPLTCDDPESGESGQVGRPAPVARPTSSAVATWSRRARSRVSPDDRGSAPRPQPPPGRGQRCRPAAQLTAGSQPRRYPASGAAPGRCAVRPARQTPGSRSPALPPRSPRKRPKLARSGRRHA